MSELNEHLQWIADYIANNDKNYVGGVFERDDTGEEFALSINKADAMRNLSDQISQLQAEKADLMGALGGILNSVSEEFICVENDYSVYGSSAITVDSDEIDRAEKLLNKLQ